MPSHYSDREALRPQINVEDVLNGGWSEIALCSIGPLKAFLRSSEPDMERSVDIEALELVLIEGDRLVGYAEMRWWDLQGISDIQQMNFDLDEIDSEATELGNVLMANWDADTLVEAGDIVELKRVWSEPSIRPRSAALSAIKSILSGRWSGAAAVFTKAFPFEHAGMQADELELEGVRRRRAALIRLYRARGGLVSMPGQLGREGWMWRQLGALPAPMAS